MQIDTMTKPEVLERQKPLNPLQRTQESQDSSDGSPVASQLQKRSATWDWTKEEDVLARKRQHVENCTAEAAAKLTGRQECLLYASLQFTKLLGSVSVFEKKKKRS